ncbi:replication protein (plasmid) [Gemmobacter aquarius]|uniref:Replication protein n=1 Tax=Paragemmobacter aquarius TaxID=2169400 RepID=A0A2S0US40_9RHOB|nr:ParB N-terminal domain-containing protein [Gemmobacter aquarius]AWB50600.1 replication protein [Gemmobacter aquarius]
MTKKRRIFDIDLPEDDVPPPVVSGGGLRRGPMATAIGENADSLRQRESTETAIRAENDSLAHEFVRLKKLGLVVDTIPVEAVHATKLVRDRSARVDADLDDLKASIKALGLSNPIRVEQVGDGRYELVQGWRRLSAYRALFEETGDPAYARIPAGLMAKGETLDSLYRRMVDENMVRKDISWAEMANLARAYTQDEATGCRDLDQAVNLLFATANPQKRSYVRRFAFLMRAMESSLDHAEAISRALGLAVASRIENEAGSAAVLARSLAAVPARTAEQELAILRAFAEAQPEREVVRGGGGRSATRGKTTLRLPMAGGEVKCTAVPGRVELRLDRDFSAVERDRLEAAVAAFFAALD